MVHVSCFCVLYVVWVSFALRLVCLCGFFFVHTLFCTNMYICMYIQFVLCTHYLGLRDKFKVAFRRFLVTLECKTYNYDSNCTTRSTDEFAFGYFLTNYLKKRIGLYYWSDDTHKITKPKADWWRHFEFECWCVSYLCSWACICVSFLWYSIHIRHNGKRLNTFRLFSFFPFWFCCCCCCYGSCCRRWCGVYGSAHTNSHIQTMPYNVYVCACIESNVGVRHIVCKWIKKRFERRLRERTIPHIERSASMCCICMCMGVGTDFKSFELTKHQHNQGTWLSKLPYSHIAFTWNIHSLALPLPPLVPLLLSVEMWIVKYVSISLYPIQDVWIHTRTHANAHGTTHTRSPIPHSCSVCLLSIQMNIIRPAPHHTTPYHIGTIQVHSYERSSNIHVFVVHSTHTPARTSILGVVYIANHGEREKIHGKQGSAQHFLAILRRLKRCVYAGVVLTVNIHTYSHKQARSLADFDHRCLCVCGRRHTVNSNEEEEEEE